MSALDDLDGDELPRAPPASEFPLPDIPTNPVLSWESFCGTRHSAIPSVLDAGSAIFVTSGRMAIALALRQMGVGPGQEVLLPAYHCVSMVAPVAWLGAGCCFYRIRPDTSVDFDDLARRLTGRTRILVAVHCFGFPQDGLALRRFCDEHGLLLLEDCAHAFFGASGGQPLGSHGDYAIASLLKFFPMLDGGCLVSSRHSLRAISLATGGLAFQSRAIFDSVERALRYQRFFGARSLLGLPFYLKKRLRSVLSSDALVSNPSSPAATHGGFGFDPAWLERRMSWCSRLVLRYSSMQRNVERRRAHYLRLLEAFSDLRECRPLHPALPPGVVPYVFPLLVDRPDPGFWDLRKQALPVLRWEFLWPGMDVSAYPISARYARQLFQIPCHQELTPEELNRMVDHIRARLHNPSHIVTAAPEPRARPDRQPSNRVGL